MPFDTLVLRPDTRKVDAAFLHALLLSNMTVSQVLPLRSGTSVGEEGVL
jgi:hypothetical protein